jgi:hypothetical protein
MKVAIAQDKQVLKIILKLKRIGGYGSNDTAPA